MPTSLVTGGAGFLGSNLCDYLLSRGHRVICIDNFETGSLQNIAHLRDDSFLFVHADITSPYHVDEDVDFVYHMASPASPIDYARLPLHTLKVGAYGTHNSLGLAKFKRARFLLASTSEVYGDPQIHPQPESYWGNVNPVGVRSVYDESKRFAEAATMAYQRHHGLDVGIVRIFNTYGPRMRPDDGRAVPTFITQALRGEPITLHGSGTQTRSICYVDDLVRGILLLLASTETGPINCGTEDEFSMRELAELIIRLTGSESVITYLPRTADDPEMRRPDLTLARTRLGFAPRVGVEEGLRRTIENFVQRVGKVSAQQVG